MPRIHSSYAQAAKYLPNQQNFGGNQYEMYGKQPNPTQNEYNGGYGAPPMVQMHNPNIYQNIPPPPIAGQGFSGVGGGSLRKNSNLGM